MDGTLHASASGDVVVADPRVLHLLPVGDAGGAQTVVEALTTGLVTAGAPVHVAGLVGTRGEHPWLRALESRGVPVHHIAAPARSYAAEANAVHALARHIGATVVHSHVYRADFVAWRARAPERAHVITAHGFTGGDLRNRAYEMVGRWLMRQADATIAVSAPLSDRLVAAGIRRDRLHTIPNVLAPREAFTRTAARDLLGLPPDAPVVGFVGRLSHEKGADQLLALAELLPAGTFLALIGDGPERPALEARATKLATLGITVRFCGLQPDAGRLVRAFDVVCLPSRTEGTPMVLLEAIAAQVPAVAFAVGGIPDVLTEFPNLLAPPGDTRTLAGRIAALMTDLPAAHRTMETLSARRALTHHPHEWVEAHRRLYAMLDDRAAMRR